LPGAVLADNPAAVTIAAHVVIATNGIDAASTWLRDWGFLATCEQCASVVYHTSHRLSTLRKNDCIIQSS